MMTLGTVVENTTREEGFMKRALLVITLVLAASTVAAASLNVRPALADENLPVYLRDRGTGVATSMFGTYLEKGQLLIYPFFEYYKNSNEEYAPNELGDFESDVDYRGDYKAYEFLLFLGYGITEDFAVELEAGVIDATLKTDPNDPSGVPEEISESGISDVEGQLRWRLARETERRPEFFSFFEVVFPVQNDKHIIGTPDWEFKLGGALVKGFSWGTLTGRASVAYTAEENKVEFGEYALEYLALEGEEDEVDCIPELQWTFYQSRPRMTLILNSAFGLTSKAQDWAPEVGVQFLF